MRRTRCSAERRWDGRPGWTSDCSAPQWNGWTGLTGDNNSARFPWFRQLDVRVDKTWEFKAWKLSAYLDLLNSYNQGNVEGISYNYNSTLRTNGQSIPIIPSIGLRGEF